MRRRQETSKEPHAAFVMEIVKEKWLQFKHIHWLSINYQRNMIWNESLKKEKEIVARQFR